MKLLLVTDTTWVHNDVAASLPPGWTMQVTDSRVAVAAAAQHQPIVVLVDLQVGSMGGFAVVRALRDATALGDLIPMKLVLLLDRQADRFLVNRSGADGALVKPFTAQELRGVLTKVTTEPPVRT
jgi:two-component system, OmpR family, response regulator